MTRKHFEAIAATIKETKLSTMDRVVFSNRIADTLAETNPRFDRALFLKACGITPLPRRPFARVKSPRT